MKPVNIYTLTRLQQNQLLFKMERQMSKRQHYLKIKSWEMDSVKEVAEYLYGILHDIFLLKFYYSFQIPKLGKEFDLLAVGENQVINVELKSGEVTEEKIKKQLELNRQYLALLGRSIRSYTYVSSTKKLYRLTNSGRLIDSDFQKLSEDILKLENVYEDHLEKLFKEEFFLISPLTDPDKFLRREYFLTSQQKDIKNKLLRNMKNKGYSLQGFTGLPGTGKTLLLYDIALELSEKDSVCVLHFGSYPEEMSHLDERLKRVDFYHCKSDLDCGALKWKSYQAILLDEGHRIAPRQMQEILSLAKENNRPVIISYDCEDAISPKELMLSHTSEIEKLPGFISFRITNRIRMNGELSSFIALLMKADFLHRRKEYPSISVVYARTDEEQQVILQDFSMQGYTYIREANAQKATCREFDKVVMVMDGDFFYDEDGCLRAKQTGEESKVRLLFHGLSRAKNAIAIVVRDNEAVFNTIMRFF